MVDNIKIRTEDVSEILDTKIKTHSAHLPLNVAEGEFYDSVLEKISDRSPTFDEKAALNAAENPSLANPYTTLSRLNSELAGRIPWASVGPVGSGADFEGSGEAPLMNALASGARWIMLRPGEYTFLDTVEIPGNTYLRGSSEGGSIITGLVDGPLLLLAGNNSTLEGFSLTQLGESAAAIRVEAANTALHNLTLISEGTGKTLDVADGVTALAARHCRFQGGVFRGVGLSDGVILSCFFDTVGVYALDLVSPKNCSVTGCTLNGQVHLQNAENVRLLGNHLNDGVSVESPIAAVVLRGNTPVSVNNESEDFADLLQYLGSPSVQDKLPLYANNYAGPPGESLTARVGALDLLTQWRYEDRNLQLVGAAEPSYVRWDPTTRLLSTTTALHLVSSHREGHWVIPQLGTWTSLVFAQQQTSSTHLVFDGNTHSLGQSFVSPFAGELVKVTVRLKKTTGATGQIRCALFASAVNGAPPQGSASLGHTNTVNVASLTTSYSSVVFEFASPIKLENLSSYALVFQTTTTVSEQVHFAVNPTPGGYTGGSVVESRNGGASWTTVAQDLHFLAEGRSLSAIKLEDGEALYYKLDRNLAATPVTLAPFIGPVGSIPNDRENRNTYVLAYCHNKTIWWRGGNGARLAATNNEVGTYHIDGTSKTLVDYMGAADTNDFFPQYTDNFSGLANEPLVHRLTKTDQRLRTLFEYSNMMIEMQSGGTLELEGSVLTLTKTLSFYFPHRKFRFSLPAKSWTFPTNAESALYVTWDQALITENGSSTVSDSIVSNGLLPFPENDGQKKYMVLARRLPHGSVQLWDGTELISGSQYPVPSSSGRTLVPTGLATTLDQNVVWTGTNLLWENLALATASGLPLTRNTFANQTTPLPGLTDLQPAQGLLVTHTWNPGSASAITVTKVSLPVQNIRQNQFLWAQNFAGAIIFGL